MWYAILFTKRVEMKEISVNAIPFDLSKIFSIVQVLGASLFLALCAQISIPLYFTPVPISAQTFGVMLIGAMLGSKKGSLAVIAYLMEGAFGLPVYAFGGLGIGSLLGPSGGYLFGFVAQAYFVGWLSERICFHPFKILCGLLCSCFIQLGLGSLWLLAFIPFNSALLMGFYPFLIGETIKSFAVAFALKLKNDSCLSR